MGWPRGEKWTKEKKQESTLDRIIKLSKEYVKTD